MESSNNTCGGHNFGGEINNHFDSVNYDHAYTRFRLYQIGRFFDSLKNEQSSLKNDMLMAAEHCIVHAIKAVKNEEVEPFKPLIRTAGYAGQCRRKKIR